MAEAAAPPVPLEPTLLEQLPPTEGAQGPEGERLALGLEKMNDLVARGTYVDAAREAQALLLEGARDVRLVGPFLFGLFVERGPVAAPLLFGSLLALLRTHWEAFGPPGRREALGDNGLRWLFKTVSKHLEHHERLKDAVWQGWLLPSSRQPLREALEQADPLIAALSMVLPKAQSAASCRHLVEWLTGFVRALPTEPAPASAEPAPPGAAAREDAAQPPREDSWADSDEDAGEDAGQDEAAGEDEEAAGMEDEEELPEEPQAPRAARRAPPRKAPRGAAPGLPVSPALELLMRKLRAFEALVRGGDFVKAGVVASDVLNVVEHFDPRLYLPELFSPFFAGLSAHAHVLEPVLHETGSLSFRALQQLYQVDLEGFLAQALPPRRGLPGDYED